MLTEPAEAEEPSCPQVQPEQRVPAAGEELPQPAAEEVLPEQAAGEVHRRSPRRGVGAGCRQQQAARVPGLRR